MVTYRAWPWRGASRSMPRSRSSAKRWRHSETVFLEVPTWMAMSLFMVPSAAASTILARRTNRAGVLRPRDHEASVCRSSSVNVRTGPVFMGFILLRRMKPRKQLKVTLIERHYTSSEFLTPRAGLTDCIRSLVGERNEILLEKSGQVASVAIKFRGIGPRGARRQQRIRHAGTVHRYLQPKDRITIKGHTIQLPTQRGP